MGKRPMCTAAFFLMIAILAADMLGISWIWRSPAGKLPQNLINGHEKAVISGEVYHQEEKQYQNQIISNLYLKHTNLIISSKKYPLRNIKCEIKGRRENYTGCVLLVKGRMKIFPCRFNPGEFDQEKYQRGRKLDYAMEDTEIRKILKTSGKLEKTVEAIRKKALWVMEKIYPSKEKGILQAMILGDKEELDTDVKEEYQAAGISHILAISGLHITMIGMAVWKGFMLCGCSIPVSSVLSFLLLCGYGLLIGSPVTSFRALLMFGILAGGKISGRAYDMATSLAVAVILLLVDNPDLLWDGGFQLSVTAVTGLILTGWLGIKKGAGLFLWFFSLPVVLFHFSQVSVAGFLCNLIVIPLMPVVLGSGCMALATGFVNIMAGSVAAFPSYMLLRLFEIFGKYAERFPAGVWTPGNMCVFTGILYYVILCTGCWFYKKKGKNNRKARWIVTAVTSIILLGLAMEPWENRQQIIMMDVGQGDGILLQQEHKGILIDGGSTSKMQVGTRVILPVLKYQGISRITGIFITHTDQDHVNGALEVIKESEKGWLTVENLYMPLWMKGTKVGKELAGNGENAGVKISYLEKGDQFQGKEIYIKILHPGRKDYTEEPNEGSLVFHCEFLNRKILFTGDLPKSEEGEITGDLKKYNILKVGHHGADNASGNEFLEKTDPEIALISCGFHNRYGHPGKKALERLEQTKCKIYRTDLQGAIVICLDRRGRIKCSCPMQEGKVY